MARNRRAGWLALFVTALLVLTWSALAAATIVAPASRADGSDATLNALIMGGTGMPTPSQAWRDSIITDYINPATGGDYTPVLVPTPESFASTSVPTGLADLQAAIAAQQAAQPGIPFVVAGYSQSAMIGVQEKIHLGEVAASGQPIPDVTFVLLGSAGRPNGGEVARFEGLNIPGMGGSFPGAEPTDLGIPTIDISNQYDFFSDFPQYPINLVADLNSLLGIA